MSDLESGTAETLKKTPLYDLHVELGAKLVPFAGYEMPVQYPSGITMEHLHTRKAAGLFDVSHMGQVRIEGEGREAALETLVPTDVTAIAEGGVKYSLFTNDEGGILDDLMISNAGDHLYLVVNAACKDQDIPLLRSALSPRQSLNEIDDHALIALQGPKAVEVLSRFAPSLAQMPFMSTAMVDLAGLWCRASRSGYTGEDGFEISVPVEGALEFARTLLADENVEPIGLGARDTLRLEAGLPLYGNDLDGTTTPNEAGLLWAVSKSRRETGSYPGADIIRAQIAEGAPRKRVGLKPEGRAPVRAGAEVVDGDGGKLGLVTSGGFSPSLGGPIAMAYVERAQALADNHVFALVRGKPLPCTIVKLPFVQQNYYRG